MSYYDSHEADSKERYNNMQGRLANATDQTDLGRLAAEMDIQLKLEDFLLKFREADHPKFKLWGSVAVPAVVSLVVAVISHKLW